MPSALRRDTVQRNTVDDSVRDDADRIGGRISYDDFLAAADEDIRAEWVDGEIHLMSPASTRHQELSMLLSAMLQTFAQQHDLGTVLAAPFQMKLGDELPGREPDLLFIAREHRERIQPTHLRGPADLAVEIVSPESRVRDRGTKFAEYELGGVSEYWIVDPDLERADFFVLDDEGRYQRLEPADGLLNSRVVDGFTLRVEWLWRQPLPTLIEVLGELGLIPRS